MNKQEAENILSVIRKDLNNKAVGNVIFETKEVAKAIKLVLEEAFYYQEEIKISVKGKDILLKTKHLNFEYSYHKNACAVFLNATIGPLKEDKCHEFFSLADSSINALIKKIQKFLIKAEPLIKLQEDKLNNKNILAQKRKELLEQMETAPIEIKDKIAIQLNKDNIYKIELNNLSEEQFKALFNKIIT